jgi:hypothetical protein
LPIYAVLKLTTGRTLQTIGRTVLITGITLQTIGKTVLIIGRIVRTIGILQMGFMTTAVIGSAMRPNLRKVLLTFLIIMAIG